MIGGGDWSADRLLPDCMRAFASGEVVELRNPGATRPWQHVLDPLSGYLTLIEASFEQPQTVSQGWNFGPAMNEALAVRLVMSHLKSHLGSHFSWQEQPVADGLHEARWLKLDCTAASEKLNWSPRFDIKQAIAMAAEWYGTSDVASRRDLVRRQIAKALQPEETTEE